MNNEAYILIIFANISKSTTSIDKEIEALLHCTHVPLYTAEKEND